MSPKSRILSQVLGIGCNAGQIGLLPVHGQQHEPLGIGLLQALEPDCAAMGKRQGVSMHTHAFVSHPPREEGKALNCLHLDSRPIFAQQLKHSIFESQAALFTQTTPSGRSQVRRAHTRHLKKCLVSQNRSTLSLSGTDDQDFPPERTSQPAVLEAAHSPVAVSPVAPVRRPGFVRSRQPLIFSDRSLLLRHKRVVQSHSPCYTLTLATRYMDHPGNMRARARVAAP